MLRAHIGKQSAPVSNCVEKGAVIKFAEAIGDPVPFFTDEKYGECTRYQGLIAPPTFPYMFNYGKIEGFQLPPAGLIHGEQAFYYKRPLQVGEKLLCYLKVHDYYEKQGSRGNMGFLIMDRVGEDMAGKEIFTSRATIILTEAVQKEMKQDVRN